MMRKTKTTGYCPSAPLVMIVGNYGSGKTEVAVNLALALRGAGREVRIADLDIVNPYFRCREARDLLEARGIRVVMPPGAQRYADLPIVVPEIKAMLRPRGDCVSLFDVGGDDAGAMLLSSLWEALGESPYSLLQVINARRPFTDSLEGCLRMKSAIEEASRLKVTGLVSNTHLIDETTAETILEGYRLARAVSMRCGVPIAFVTAMGDLAEDAALRDLPAPVMRLERHMLPPWIAREPEDVRPSASGPEPAPPARPIFRP